MEPALTGDRLCPCGSGQTYGACCSRFFAGLAVPLTAEQLMRSRYAAYAVGNAVWLRDTWHPATRPQDLSLDDAVRWLGLEILARSAGGPEDDRGIVEFVARYKVGGRAHRLHERSRFRRLDGRWYYLDGDPDSEPGVQDPSRGDAPDQTG